MKICRQNNISRRRSGHRPLQSRWSEKYFLDNKQRNSLLDDVTCDSDVFVNIAQEIKTHRYRRRLKGYCKEHRFLYHALRACYEKNHQDGFLISEIITEIYLCEGSLVAIFSILLPHHVTRNSFCLKTKLNALYAGASTKQSNHGNLEFYLKFICNNTEVSQNAMSLENVLNEPFEVKRGNLYTPLTAATSSRASHFVLLLLRYGADPFYAPQSFDGEFLPDPVASTITGLNSIILFKNSFFSEETLSALSEEEKKGMDCIEYIARSSNNIPLEENMHFQTSREEDESREPTSRKKTYNLHPKLAARLDIASLTGPRSLQHLCRLTIRKQLTECGHKRSLPSRIEQLPLPTQMKNYIDLMF